LAHLLNLQSKVLQTIVIEVLRRPMGKCVSTLVAPTRLCGRTTLQYLRVFLRAGVGLMSTVHGGSSAHLYPFFAR
jgi:hypothetical protein